MFRYSRSKNLKFIWIFVHLIVTLHPNTNRRNGLDMCTGNIKINDEVMEMVRPHFEGDKELWAWVENVVDQAMKDYAAQFTSALKDSTNERIYQQIKALEKDPKGFLKLNSILKPSQYSAEDLRDDYISEKYGV